MSATSVDHHNKIAVLPFTYLMDNQPGTEAIGLKAQEDTYGFLSQHSAGYTILDPRTTSATLAKAGVSLHIYMDNNASIYNQTHKAFLSNTDGSYSSPLEYLLKRCPLYRK